MWQEAFLEILSQEPLLIIYIIIYIISNNIIIISSSCYIILHRSGIPHIAKTFLPHVTMPQSLVYGIVTPYFVPLQTFPHLFLQLVATARPMVACYQRDARIVPTGDKSRQHPQKLTCHNDYFIFFLKIFRSLKKSLYL